MVLIEEKKERKFSPKPRNVSKESSRGRERTFRPPVNIHAGGEKNRGGGHDILNTVYGKGSARVMKPAVQKVTEAEPVKPKKKRTFTKPYNLYDPKGPEVRAQNKMNSTIAAIPGAVGDSIKGAAGIVTNTADILAGGKGARAVIDTVANSISSATNSQKGALADIRAGKEQYPDLKQSEAVAKVRNNRFVAKRVGNRDSNVMSYGEDGRRVFSNMPVKEQAPVQNTNGIAVAAEVPVEQPAGEAPERQFTPPPIRETPNAQRDAELGKMTSSAETTVDGGEKRTFSIGGNNMSINLSEHDLAVKKSLEDIDSRIAKGFKPNPEQAKKIQQIKEQAGSNRGGTDKRSFSPGGTSPQEHAGPRTFKTGNIDVQFDDSVDTAAQKRFLAPPPVSPTTDQLKQYDYQQGLKSGRFTRPVDPTLNMTPEERIAYRNTQANIQNNIRNNETDMAGVNSQNAERQSNIANNTFALNQQQQIQQLEQAYMNAPDEQTRKVLERQIYVLKGQSQPKTKIFTERFTDPITGESVSQNYSRDAEGNVTRLVPEQFPSVPSIKDDLVKGKVYQTQKGLGRWEGKQFRRMELDQYGRAQPTK